MSVVSKDSKETPTLIVTSHLRVRYAETDAMGIVYHANYFVWMEVGRTDYFREIGFPYRQLETDHQLHTPLVDVRCRYYQSAYYDDEILIETQISQLEKRLIKFHYLIFRENDHQRLAEGESTHLVIDSQRRRASLPEELLRALRKY
jgi:acyl-CoA thioester hydrolase